MIQVSNKEIIKRIENALPLLAKHFRFASILNSSDTSDKYDCLAGFSNTGKLLDEHVLDHLKKMEKEESWHFFSIAYDLKNEIEDLKSDNFDGTKFPMLTVFQPEVLFIKEKSATKLLVQDLSLLDFEELEENTNNLPKIDFTPRISKSTYLKSVEFLKEQIQLGNIYEANYCQEFYQDNIGIDSTKLYRSMLNKAVTPFSAYYKAEEFTVISASPERFIQRKGSTLVSQPIKGTIKRGLDFESDQRNRDLLSESIKDRNENVMIVDLVRNDMSRIAKDNSVKVNELCGIYAFPQVFQLVSTISCEVEDGIGFSEIIEELFPMGSMTGAPKIKCMELIEESESFKRGIYSGTLGYMEPNGDFDTNVVIRSLIYNEKEKYLSYSTGGAITAMSNPEEEYEECIVKAEAIKVIIEDYAN